MYFVSVDLRRSCAGLFNIRPSKQLASVDFVFVDLVSCGVVLENIRPHQLAGEHFVHVNLRLVCASPAINCRMWGLFLLTLRVVPWRRKTSARHQLAGVDFVSVHPGLSGRAAANFCPTSTGTFRFCFPRRLQS